MPVIHLIAQFKGGVGKSFIAFLLGQYLRTIDKNVLLYDIDPNNQSLSSFQALKVLKLLKVDPDTHQVKQSSFDGVLKVLISQKVSCVVDSGASTYNQMLGYLADHSQMVVHVLQDSGFKLVIHMPVMAGPSRTNCIECVNEVSSVLTKARLVVWENNYLDHVISEKDRVISITELLSKSAQEKISCIVKVPFLNPELDLEMIKYLLNQHLTFDEVVNSLGEGKTPISINGRPITLLDVYRYRYLRDEYFEEISKLKDLAI